MAAGGIVQAIAAFFSSIGAVFSFMGDRSKLKNTSAQKANVDAARDIKEKEKIETVIEESERTGNLDKEREHFS